LFFWPETAFPGFPLNDSSLSQLLSSWAKITKGFHLIGAYEEASESPPGAEGDQVKMYQYNVVAAYSSEGEFKGHYRKVVRMPFGEYIPGDQYYPWIYDQFPFLNNFGKGQRHLPLPHDSANGPVFLPFICFEILDEGYVKEAARTAREQFPGRDLIFVNPTNDSWFGEGAELFLHSHLAIWQAAREGIALVRPTNTGLSMVIAPWGEVLARGRVGVESMILTELPVTK
jgi:apolipoprotein N-acyltransferase